MLRTRSIIRALAVGLVLAGAGTALAVDERNTTAGMTAAGAPLALHGFDPVAYFTVKTPTVGSPQYAVAHEGATYYFASPENLDAFQANPGRYAPAFGGFCAYGVSLGKKFDGDPHYWKVVDDRLYLNLNKDIAEKFSQDVPGNVAKAASKWRTIEHTAVRDL